MRILTLNIFLLLFCTICNAEEVTYSVSEFNSSTQDFVIKAWGRQPEQSAYWFWNEYGATTGNRYNQIPRNREASFTLMGWQKCTINSITLGMCSNNKAGSFSLVVADDAGVLLSLGTADFSEWYGQWVSKDLGIYVDITRDITTIRPVEGDLTVTIKGGTTEGSVYVKTLTVDYSIPEGISTESPMGYAYEKVAAKGTLEEGDVVMLYRSGDAAGDLGGMQESQYLDAIGVSSITNLYEYDVARFTLAHADNGTSWVFTDQYGRKLGAVSGQALAWDDGETAWNVSLGYDGATITSVNSNYGTLRYNAPVGSYPRFRNYTSNNSLQLPFIYKRKSQNQPVLSTKLLLPYNERTIALGSQDTLVIKPVFMPASVTDTRVAWKSSDEKVATVSDGIVSIKSVGETLITAASKDGGSNSSMKLIVLETSGISNVEGCNSVELQTIKVIRNNQLVIIRKGNSYNAQGIRIE